MFDKIIVGSINFNTIIKILIILFIFLVFKNIVVKYFIKFIKKLSDKWNKNIISLSIDSTEKYLKRFIIFTGIYCALLVIPFNQQIVFFINFNIMSIFEEEQVEFAFPSVSVYMEK